MGDPFLGGEVPQDDLGDGGAPAGDVAPGAHLPLEDGRERVLVGDVEHAERGDRLVDLDGVHVLPEAAPALAALEDALDRVDDGPVERAHDGRLLQVPAPRLVLRHDQPHEALVLEVVGVGELHDATDRVHRGKVIQIETALRLADVRVDLLQHGQVDLLLAAEVVVDECARGVGPGRDRVHARALEPARGELLESRAEDAGPVRLGSLGLAHGLGHAPRPDDALPGEIHDVKAYVRWFRAKAKEYNIAPDRIGVWGTSRGGHLDVVDGEKWY